MGRIDAGDDVVEALTLLCDANDVGAADVRVAGTVADVELVRFDPDTKEYATVVADAGPFDVVHFTGNMARLGDQPVLRADALLAVHGPAGQQLVFGQLRRATAVDCEFVVHSFSDLALNRRFEPSTGRFPIESVERNATAPAPSRPAAEPTTPPQPATPRPKPETISKPAGTARRAAPEPEPEPEPAPKAGSDTSKASWGDAIEASEEMGPATRRRKKALKRTGATPKEPEDVYGEYDYHEKLLKPGDILDHPKLGECRVIKVEEDEYAHIRLSRGQIRKLALEVVELEYVGERDGKDVFKVRVRK